MEKERGMEERPSTPALQEFPQLSRLHFFSPQTQGVIAAYLAHLRARHYAPARQEATIRALKSFAVLMPEARQAALYADLTQTTPSDIDAWIEASCRHQLAPGTVATRLRLMQGFFACLCDQGYVSQSPIRLPRHYILVPQDLPRPMAEEEVIAFFRVIDALRDRTMFLLMLRCGLRVSEVSPLPGPPSTWPRAPSALRTAKDMWIGWSIWPLMWPKPFGSGTGSRRWRHAMGFPAVSPARAGCPSQPGKSTTG